MIQMWQPLTIGALSGVLSIALVIVVRQQQRLRRAHFDLMHDPTTGLANRRAVTASLRTALRQGRPTGLVVLDLDRFKAVNDTYGHEYGNDLLAQIGRRLATLGSPVVVVARLSGDEFAVIVDGEPLQTAAVADTALTVIMGRPVRLGSDLVAVSASVGYATASLGVMPRELLHAADLAMYQAKRHGRATVCGLPAPEGLTGIGRSRRFRDVPRSADDGDTSTPQ